MDIIYLGHSSFKFKGKFASVVTDPFDPAMVGLKFSGVDADVVTVSHEHADHNKSDLVNGVKKIVSGPGEYEIMGVSIIGIPSYHDDKKGEERGKNTIYVFEMDGLRLCHLGDLGHDLTEKMLEEIGTINILMVPVGGEFTIDASKAVAVAQAIEANIVIPMHYQMPGMKEEISSKLFTEEAFLKEIGLLVERLPKLSIKKEDLQDEQKVVVLEKK